MRKRFEWFDDKLIELINDRIKTDFLDKYMLKITNLGGLIFIGVLVILLVVFGNDRIRFIGVQAGMTLFISQTIVYTLKTLLSRERPYNILEHLNTFGITLKDYSFPSGHSSASFSVATTIALNIPKISILVLIIALVIGISRIYIGVHYPTDVAAGMILGIGSAFIVHMYLLEYVRSIVDILKI